MKRTVYIKSIIKLETDEPDLSKLQVSVLGVSQYDYKVHAEVLEQDEWVSDPDNMVPHFFRNAPEKHIESLSKEIQKLEGHMEIAVFMLQRLTKRLKGAQYGSN